MLAAARGSLTAEVLLEVEDKHFKGGGEAFFVRPIPVKTARDYAVRKQRLTS